MRLFFLVSLLMLAPFLSAQQLLDQEVSVAFNQLTIERSLNLLERTAGVNFSYNSTQINSIEKKITTTFEQTPIRTILDYLFSGTALLYKELGSQITVYKINSTSEKVVLSGYIRERHSGEELIGARIAFPEYGVGCISNTYGYYALEVPKGKTYFTVASLGMLAVRDSILIEDEMVMNFHLYLDTLMLTTVEVRTDSLQPIQTVADLPGIDRTIITPEAISKVPAASGERDLLRHIQQLPGVQPSTDGGANFQVRGSGIGGNLVLIDEIPIYHPTHLLGIYSIVNTDALKSATLYKDFIPLKYGTRSASVLQITTKDGNLNKPHVSGGLSGFMARLNVEGPLAKKRASFYLSSRVSTFPGALYSIVGNRQLGSPSFFDTHGKVNFHLNSNNRIYFTGYYGKDRVANNEADYQWGNVAGSFRWNHIINTKTFSNLSLTHSEFAYGYDRTNPIVIGEVGNSGLITLQKKDIRLGQKVVTDKAAYDITHYKSNSVTLNYGLSAAVLRTNQGSFGDANANLFLERVALENGFYGSIEKKFSRRLKLEAGIRFPFSFHIGTGDTTAYLNADFSQTQVVYEKNKLYDPVFFVDPRVMLSYRLSEFDVAQFSTIITSQNTHIVNYVNYFLPIEIWTPSNAYLRPQRNLQTSLGWSHVRNNLQTSLIVYNKFVMNVLDYASPVFISSTDIESNLLAGKLHVWGAEFMVTYKFTTWYSAALSYAYTNTKQQIDGVNNNQPYKAPGDRPHYLSFSQFFNLSKKWQITANFIAHTGTAITLPNGQFLVDGTAFPLYSGERNAERMPTFRRFDLSFKRNLGVQKQRDNWDLTFNITNFFRRYNPSVAYVERQNGAPSELEIKSIDYSPFMISLNLSFRY